MQRPRFLIPLLSMLSIYLGTYAGSVSAAEASREGVLVSVDGKNITADMLSVLQGSRQHGPLADLEQNQNELLDSLITTELLFNAAKQARLEQQKDIALELELAHKTLLSQFYVKQYMDQQVFDESTLKAAYDIQKPALMARMIYWSFDNKANAETFLSKAMNGQVPPASMGEELPWQTLENYPFAHLPEAATLKDGQWISVPVQDELGWMVWRCLESSTIPKPSFEDAREGIRQELATQRLHSHIEQLRAQAHIQRPRRDN